MAILTKTNRLRLAVTGLASVAYVVVQTTALSLVASIESYFQPRALGIGEHIIAIICTAIPAIFIPQTGSAASAAAWVFYAFIYLSAGVVGISVCTSVATYLPFMTFMAVALAIFYCTARIRIPISWGVVRASYLDIYLLIVTIILIIVTWQLTGFTMRFGFDDVYERRLNAREAVGYSGYIIAPLKLLLPIVAIYAWTVRRNLIWAVVLAFASLGVFSFDGSKSVLFFPFLLWLIMTGVKRGQLPAILLGSIAVVNAMAFFEYKLIGSTVLTEYGTRRAFVVPGLLSSIYWEFAPEVSNLQSITYDVGRLYFDNAEINANANFLMWGLAWGGLIGGGLMAFLGGCIVSIFMSFPGSRFPWLGALMASGCTLFWAEQFLHTSMLSSGVGYLIIIAIALRLAPDGFRAFIPRGAEHRAALE